MPEKDQSTSSPQARLRPGLLDLLASALVAPLAAALPVLTVGYAAWVMGSASHALYVEAFFRLLTLAWPCAVMVGLPLWLLLRRLGWSQPSACALAGIALALVARWLLGDDDPLPFDTVPWATGQWAALIAYGWLAGWVFGRRLRDARASSELAPPPLRARGPGD